MLVLGIKLIIPAFQFLNLCSLLLDNLLQVFFFSSFRVNWRQTLLLRVEERTKIAQTVSFAQAPNHSWFLNNRKTCIAFLNEGKVAKRLATVVTAGWRLTFTFTGFGSIVTDY